MKKLYVGLFLSCIASIAFSDTVAPPIKLQLKHSNPAIPAGCEEIFQTAEAEFNKKWVVHLYNPSRTEIIDSDDSQEVKGKEYLAPVGTEAVFFSQRQVTGQFTSLFVNCETREGFVLARGGLADRSTWHGPFRF